MKRPPQPGAKYLVVVCMQRAARRLPIGVAESGAILWHPYVTHVVLYDSLLAEMMRK
jgi:hypothetical protein